MVTELLKPNTWGPKSAKRMEEWKRWREEKLLSRKSAKGGQ